MTDHDNMESDTMIADAHGGADTLSTEPIYQIPLADLHPSPENAELYRPVDSDDPEIQALAETLDYRRLPDDHGQGKAKGKT